MTRSEVEEKQKVFLENVRTRIKEKGMSVRRFEKEIDVCDGNMYKMAKGRYISLPVALRMSDVLGMTIDELCKGGTE